LEEKNKFFETEICRVVEENYLDITENFKGWIVEEKVR
jgi:hypothetical protein